MRALRVVGLDADGKAVICEDPERGERFLLPADDRLRAAASGDVTRLGQMATDVESPMRPREIQARIRAGESVEQVAAVAGLPANRVERFAYPVLLERARAADLAQRAHPVREDGPDVQTLGEVIAHAFGLRGHDYSATTWDAWRGEDNKWVVQLLWRAGRSDNRAHWVYHPGAQGGTVTALDEHAVDLMDPSPNRPLRTVRPVTQLARQALELAPDTDEQAAEIAEPAAAAAGHTAPVHNGAYGPPPAPNPPARPATPPEPAPSAPPTRGQGGLPASPPARPEPAPVPSASPTRGQVPASPPARPEPAQVPSATRAPVPASPPAQPEPAQAPAPTWTPEPTPAPEPTRAEEPARVAEQPPELFEPEPEQAAQEPAPEPEAAKPAAPPAAERKPDAPAAGRKSGQSAGKGRKNRPIVPSWEDVLLGVRTPRE